MADELTTPETTTQPTAEDVTPVVTEPATEPAASGNDNAPAALTPEATSKELARARKEAATYREKLRKHEEAEAAAAEAKRRKDLTAEQRAKEAEEKAKAAVEAAEARALRAERKANITGKVADAEAALKLLDHEKHLTSDGAVNLDALLSDYPFLAPHGSEVAPSGTAAVKQAGDRREIPTPSQEQIAERKRATGDYNL